MKTKKSIPDNNRTINDAPKEAAPKFRGSSDRGSYGMIPHTDMAWVLKQKPSVMTLFLECWLADSYGSRWMQLNTQLKSTAFTEAKKVLSKRGLFVFMPQASIQDGRSNVCWMVRNLRGSRVKDFLKESTAPTNLDTAPAELDAAPAELDNVPAELDAAPTKLDAAYTVSISPQTKSQSGSQESSLSFQYYFMIFSRSLSRAERENFETFVREEWRKKTTKPGQPGEEIISLERFLAKEEDCKNWYALFLSSSAGRAAKQEAIAAQYDWENHPRFDEWLRRAFYEGVAWAQEEEAEREQRSAFLEWAQATDPYKGRLY